MPTADTPGPARNGSGTPDTGAGPGPALFIVQGNPSAEEVAALVAVLSARTASAGATRPRTLRSEWSSRSRLLRAPLQRGAGGWRASARPR
jgi:Acyl-CoA carboxylase epsilon subunit